jgi:hypothetical protein
VWYNIYVVKRGTLAENGVRNTDEESRNLNAQKDNRHKRPHLQVSSIRKIVANIFRKPLDKTYIIWYNIYSEREVRLMYTYLATLFSKTLDRFVTDCNSAIFGSADMAEWIAALPDYYNQAYDNVDDFEIISIVKLGE